MCECRRVVGAVAAHRHQLALGLLVADQLQLVLGRRLRQEVVSPGFGCDGGCRHRVVAGDHDRADAHAAQFCKALADTALDDVLEVDDAEQAAVLGNRKRRAARLGDLVRNRLKFAGSIRVDGRLQRTNRVAARHGLRRAAADIVEDRVHRALADRRRPGIDATHAGLCGEGHEGRGKLLHVAAADAVFLLGQHDDRAAFGRFVGERGKLCRIG